MAFGRRWVAAAVCVPLLAVGGCSDDDPEPKFAPSESPSPTATSAPEPAAWEVKSEDGAVAFANHWVDVFNQAATSGRTEQLEAISDSSCQTCANFVSSIRDIYDSGGSFRSTGWQIVSFSLADKQVAQQATLALKIRQPAEDTLRPGKPPEHTEPGTVSYQANLEWGAGKWSMTDLLFMPA